ncbi:MAG: hypothetical protein EX270_01630 [Pseudomonadales bacterium]|nr:MAG: hypothetical protein EX270_01630 [Pseudomonadales bacterium]
MSSFIDFDEIKQRVSINQVVQWLDIRLEEVGDQLRGCCPIHKGTNNRDFVVTPDKGLFYCFKCKEGGDLIKLYANVKFIDQKSAAAEILKRIDIGKTARPKGREQASNSAKSSDSKRGNGKLPPLKPLDYLLSEHNNVQALGISQDTAETFGAGFATKGVMRGYIAIPVHDREGTLVAYAGRSPNPSNSTLKFAKGFDPSPIIFNAHRCEPESVVQLAHDPLEILQAYQNGVESNIVAFLTEDISPWQLGQLAVFLDDLKCRL